MPRISIVIPAYNSADLIAQTLASALALEHDDKEVIVVDDGSSDGTADVAAGIAGVRVIWQANAGDSAARNTGLEASTGDYLIFLDHDDLLLPYAAAHHLAAIEADGGYDLVFGSNDLIDSAGRVVGENVQAPRTFTGRDMVLGITPSFSQCMYRRSALSRIGGFRPQAGAAADHDLNLRLLGREGRGLIHGRKVMQYRLHQAQQTKSPARMYRVYLATLRNLLGPGGELEDIALLRQAEAKWQAYFGKFLPAEVFRMMRQGKFDRAASAVGLFARIAPRAVPSFARYWRSRLSAAGTRTGLSRF